MYKIFQQKNPTEEKTNIDRETSECFFMDTIVKIKRICFKKLCGIQHRYHLFVCILSYNIII